MQENIARLIDELGVALRESEAYTTQKQAEKELSNMPELVEKINLYNELDISIQDERAREGYDFDLVNSLKEKQQALLKEFSTNETMITLTKAQNDFSRLVYQVNNILQFMISGIKPHESCEDCRKCQKCTLGE